MKIILTEDQYGQLMEMIKLDIKVGDTIMGGKFKNKKIVVKTIGKNDKGDITINGKPLLRFRIIKENMKKTMILDKKDLTRIVKQTINENFKEISWEDIWFKLRRLSQSFQFPDDVYSFGGLDFMVSEDGEGLDLIDFYKDPYVWRNEYDEGVEVLKKYSIKIKNFVDEFNLKYDYPFTLMFKMDSKYNMKFYTED
jgi:hypothetical protein